MTSMALNGSAGANVKQARQRALLEVVARVPIGSQEELVELLREAGYEVTQATVSRDAAELGLVKVPRGDRHVYATPETAATGNLYDTRLRRLLEDIPVRIGRSGLSLVLLAMYLIENIGSMVTGIDWLRALSLFHYLKLNTIAVSHVVNWTNLGVLIAVAIVFLALSVIAFKRRDINIS